MSLDTGMVRMAVGQNMRSKAQEQELSAAHNGVGVEIKTTVYSVDGAKNWPTVLAETLCKNPKLATGTRKEMADLITREMKLEKSFSATRLSRELAARAKKLVDAILLSYGYTPLCANSGIGIRDAVAAGPVVSNARESTIKTTFHPDGLELDDRWYRYERIASYDTGLPWYCFGVRFAGDLIPLKTVLSMRGFGICEFQTLDAAAMKGASSEKAAARARLLAR